MTDKKGKTIFPGDLLRSYHYTGPRREIHYLYHVAVWTGNSFDAVPTSHLEPRCVMDGGRCRLSPLMASEMEIIHGSVEAQP